MAHRSFHLHKRPSRKQGKYIYYVQFYDDDGNRLNAKSTGQSSKTAAENWAYEQIKKGLVFIKGSISFGDYAQGWWVWDKCEYIKRRLARGRNISPDYTDTMRRYLVLHVLPFFGNTKLHKITPRLIEDWLFSLKEKIGRANKPLAASTANCCLKTLKIMMNEAVRREYININPCKKVEPLVESPKEKSILNMDEVRKLFKADTIDQIWYGDLYYFTVNLLAASTGMRMGECQALKIGKVYNEYVSVHYNWSQKYGLKPPKSNSYRDIPIPQKTSMYLNNLISMSPYQEMEDFVFFGEDRSTPIYHKKILNMLYIALKNIGISPEEREKRNITFHSWRHFFNTFFRGRIPDSKLQRLTEHKTIEMTEHYTHFSIDDFKDVQEIQEEYFGKNV